MSNELKFNIAADSSRAVAAFTKVGAAAKKSKKEVKDLSTTASPAKQWQAADKAVAAYSRRLDEASKKTSRLAQSTSKWRGALSRGLKVGAVALAGAAVVGSGVAMRAAAEREAAVGRLGGTLGDAAQAQQIGGELAHWGARNAADPNELIKHTDRLIKAGVSADSAMQAVKSAVIAAAGDASKMEGILEPLTEFATKGFIEEEILDKFAELGVDMRAGLQEQLGMTREQLDSAVSSHAVTADEAIKAMAALTAAGTKLHDSHAAALSGMAGSVAQISAQLKEAQIAFGDGLNKGFMAAFDAIGSDFEDASAAFTDLAAGIGQALGFAVSSIVIALRDAGNAVLSAAEWVADKLGIDYKADRLGERRETIQRDWPAFTSPETEAEKATAARRRASASVAASRLAARDKAAAEELKKNLDAFALANAPTGARTRTDISYAAGFGGANISSADISAKMDKLGVSQILAKQRRAADLEKILSDLSVFGLDENSTAADFAAAAGDDWDKQDELLKLESRISALAARAGIQSDSLSDIAAGVRADANADLDTTRQALKLSTLRDELKVIEDEEKKVAEITADYERRMAIQDALLAGDKERANLLTQQAEAEKLANEYAAKGIDLASAQAMAASEIARKNAKPAEKAVFDPTAANVKLRETISSPLANIGGGGVRIRFYENQQLRAATDTAAHTADIATVTSQILTHLQTKSQTAILA